MPSKCAGCSENFYNGNNPYGIKECWNLRDAQSIMRRRVGLWETPPWTAKPERLLSCYRQKGFVFVDPNQEK
jgi:hypothetical protein